MWAEGFHWRLNAYVESWVLFDQGVCDCVTEVDRKITEAAREGHRKPRAAREAPVCSVTLGES